MLTPVSFLTSKRSLETLGGMMLITYSRSSAGSSHSVTSSDPLTTNREASGLRAAASSSSCATQTTRWRREGSGLADNGVVTSVGSRGDSYDFDDRGGESDWALGGSRSSVARVA